ncbi:hypothetical protein HCU64_23335 [Methylobacterium sp. C25]|uniref:hypothetical protein n=1 Tax=Methylobacterium sp. C25 TaxID=2721622 RepID=UPI001F35C889|nr:hypothetical protein [Methylobacterium sp. C25]MCE4226680.1 hypothetical protein [Methylobacterium sp. C25]
MSICATGATRRHAGMSDAECRARRLARERAALAERFEHFLVEIPDAVTFDFTDLRHLAGYRVLEPEGLIHAGVWRVTGRITILVATSRVFRRPDLRTRLFALRDLAERELKRVVVATPRGLLNETARLRARREAGLVVAPAALPLPDAEA